jgi:membrane-anchored protein YejM (alkaline phosphatase superfamily)
MARQSATQNVMNIRQMVLELFHAYAQWTDRPSELTGAFSTVRTLLKLFFFLVFKLYLPLLSIPDDFIVQY